MKENILILGAGLMQKPAICAAKKIANTIVIDADRNAVCVPLADEFYNIDLKDREGIYDLALKLNEGENHLLGIFTAGTDFSASVSYAGEKLSLNCHSFQSALNASNKNLMRQCFKDFKIPSPDFKVFSSSGFNASELESSLLKQMNFPLVVKPCDNMGARGCRMVRNLKELLPAVQDGFKYSRSGKVIVEEFMDGPEFSIDALVYNGTLTITGFADRHIYFPPYFIETGHTMPSSIEENKKLQLISAFACGIKSLGLTCGAAKADIKFTSKGPMIGEIAARLSGGYMSGWTFPYSSDFPLTEQALKIACGIKPERLLEKRIPLSYFPPDSLKDLEKPFDLYEIPSVRASAERAWISIPGTIKEIMNLQAAEHHTAVENVLPRAFKPGDEVEFPRNNVSKCGNVISIAESIPAAASYCEKAASEIVVRLEPNNKKTEGFLSGIQSDSEKDFPPDAWHFYSEIKNLQISGVIPENQPVKNFIPDELKKYFKTSEKNWNYLTPAETVEAFDRMFPVHKTIPSERFFKALFRGGLEAIIYVSDSVSEN